jgi:hypothetical protein
MSRWFRLYADAMRNPKVARLSDKEFRLWVRLLSVASENEGAIPPLDDLKHVLSMRLDHLSSGVDRLISGGLIDALDEGYTPHSWAKFQYKSDVSTARVVKHREKRNVSETPPETEAETDTEPTPAKAVVVARKRARTDTFEIPDWVPAEPWAAFCAMRLRKKAKVDSYIAGQLFGKLEAIAAAGWDITKVMNKATVNNWTDLHKPTPGRDDDLRAGSIPASAKAMTPTEMEALRASLADKPWMKGRESELAQPPPRNPTHASRGPVPVGDLVSRIAGHAA